MAETYRNLADYCLLLKNGHPEAYDEFCNAVERYVGELFAGIVRCPPEELNNYQGRVQQAHGFLHLLKNCHLEVNRSKPAAQ